MRTKALLCVAGMLAAGAATSMAQVYSLNTVGYVSVTVTNHHYALVSNPLLLSGSANTVSNLLDAAMPPGGSAYGFTPGTTFFTMTRSLFGHTWSGGGTNLLPNGTGFFINNSSGNNV